MNSGLKIIAITLAVGCGSQDSARNSNGQGPQSTLNSQSGPIRSDPVTVVTQPGSEKDASLASTAQPCVKTTEPIVPNLKPTLSLPNSYELYTYAAQSAELKKLYSGTFTGGTNFSGEPYTAAKVCETFGYQKLTAAVYDQWNSPGDNYIVYWEPSTQRFGVKSARDLNSWITALSCETPITKEVCK